MRNLAERVVSASSEIKGHVVQSGGDVRAGSVLVAEASARLGEILVSIRNNALAMKDISVACGEQANAVNEISTAVAQMEDHTAQNAVLVDRTSTLVLAADSELGRLETMVRRFRLSAPASNNARSAPRKTRGRPLLANLDRRPSPRPRRARAASHCPLSPGIRTGMSSKTCYLGAARDHAFSAAPASCGRDQRMTGPSRAATQNRTVPPSLAGPTRRSTDGRHP